MIYVLRDYKIHLKKTEVLIAEIGIASIMTIDMILFSIVKKFKISLTFILEWLFIILFVLCFVYILLKGINSIDEDIEVSLMIL